VGQQRTARSAIRIRRLGLGPEYVEAMWKMLQCDQPDDFVVASGAPTRSRNSSRQLSSTSGSIGGITSITMLLVRSSDIMYSLGNPTKVAQVLDWRSSVKLPEIVERDDSRGARPRSHHLVSREPSRQQGKLIPSTVP
jgi:GDP-D-mannose dehydratase